MVWLGWWCCGCCLVLTFVCVGLGLLLGCLLFGVGVDICLGSVFGVDGVLVLLVLGFVCFLLVLLMHLFCFGCRVVGLLGLGL